MSCNNCGQEKPSIDCKFRPRCGAPSQASDLLNSVMTLQAGATELTFTHLGSARTAQVAESIMAIEYMDA